MGFSTAEETEVHFIRVTLKLFQENTTELSIPISKDNTDWIKQK